MALPSISTPKVKIVNKDLEAWIRLPALEEGEHYTIEYLHDVLRVNQITYGIDEAQLQKIIDEEKTAGHQKEVACAVFEEFNLAKAENLSLIHI